MPEKNRLALLIENDRLMTVLETIASSPCAECTSNDNGPGLRCTSQIEAQKAVLNVPEETSDDEVKLRWKLRNEK